MKDEMIKLRHKSSLGISLALYKKGWAISDIDALLAEIPDVDDVVHAAWEDVEADHSVAECSRCGEQCDMFAEDEDAAEVWREFCKAYAFCPFCGAKMDKEADNG